MKRRYIVIKDDDIEILKTIKRHFKEKYGRDFPYSHIVMYIVREYYKEHLLIELIFTPRSEEG
jgi:hypothetical protein